MLLSMAARAWSSSWMHSSRQMGFQAGAEARVGENVVPAERLLDHDEVKGVERLQQRRVFQPIRGIRIDHQPDARKSFAERADRLDIIARLDLDLDALVTRRQFLFDFADQRCDRGLDADRNAAWNFLRIRPGVS